MQFTTVLSNAQSKQLGLMNCYGNLIPNSEFLSLFKIRMDNWKSRSFTLILHMVCNFRCLCPFYTHSYLRFAAGRERLWLSSRRLILCQTLLYYLGSGSPCDHLAQSEVKKKIVFNVKMDVPYQLAEQCRIEISEA